MATKTVHRTLLSETLILVAFDDFDRTRDARKIARLCAAGYASKRALILDLSAVRFINWSALRSILTAAEKSLPPALSLIVPAARMSGMFELQLAAAHRGWVLGAFADRDAAIRKSESERTLHLAESLHNISVETVHVAEEPPSLHSGEPSCSVIQMHPLRAANG